MSFEIFIIYCQCEIQRGNNFANPAITLFFDTFPFLINKLKFYN